MACAAALCSMYGMRLEMSVESFRQSRLATTVLAEYTHESRFEGTEHRECPGLGDVTRVNHALDSRTVDQLDDARHVPHVVVGIAHDSDAHASVRRV
jgi:hypothetical protein